MKKFYLSLLICVMMLCGSMVFSSCGKDKSYNIANLEKDFVEIVNKYDYIELDNKNNLTFNYDKFVFNSNHYFTEALSIEPYTNLNEVYNPLVRNSMEFISNHISVCKDAKKVDRSLRDQLTTELENFDTALSKTNSYMINVADILKLRFNVDITTEPCLIRLENLFATYDELYSSIFALSETMSKIYFNYMVTDSNPNHSLIALKDFDSNSVLRTLKSRVSAQIVNLTESYVEQNVKGSDLHKTLTSSNEGSFKKIGQAYYDYVEDVNLMTYDFSSELGNNINLSDKKQEFYEASIMLYNTQASLENGYDAYRKACEEVVYCQIKLDENATPQEKICKKIIDDRHALIEENNLALNKILEIIRTF